MIITIARESGSGGYTVGAMLAKHYGIPIYDRDSLSGLAGSRVFMTLCPCSSTNFPPRDFSWPYPWVRR